MVAAVERAAPRGCPIVLVTLPPLGEAPDHPLNRAVGEWNAALRTLGAARPAASARCADLGAACAARLPAAGGAPFPPKMAAELNALIATFWRARLAHALLRRSWDKVRGGRHPFMPRSERAGLHAGVQTALPAPFPRGSLPRGTQVGARNKLALLVDFVHMNDSTAKLLGATLAPALAGVV